MNTILLVTALLSQIGAPVRPGGVSVDGNGVLQSATAQEDPRLAELRKKAAHMKKDDQLLYISLPRLLAEARDLQKAGQALPDRIKFLGGLTRLQYVFVYPEQNDLVIAGPAEPFDTDVPYRPLGHYTGRPVLQLDDLIVALRACGPGRVGNTMGCDLQMPQEIADRIKAKTKELAPQVRAGSMGTRRAAELIAEAGGNQPIKYFGLDLDTRYAFVCIEADYDLKQLAMGVLDTPVKKMKSYNELATKPEASHRFVLESNPTRLAVTPDGLAFEFRGAALKVETGRMFLQPGEKDEVSDAAKKFSKQATDNMEELTRYVSSWADLGNLADLAVLAALMGADKLNEKIGLESLLVTEFKIASFKTPSSAKTITSCRAYGDSTIFTSGGVLFQASACVKERAKDEKLSAVSARPDKEWCVAKKK